MCKCVTVHVQVCIMSTAHIIIFLTGIMLHTGGTLYNIVYDVNQQMTVKLNAYISVISDEMITFCHIHRRQPRPPQILKM